MGRKAEVKAAESRARAAELMREALALLEEASVSTAVFYLKLGLAELELGPLECDTDVHVRHEVQGDAFAHAVGAMAAIVEGTAKREGKQYVDAIAKAMEDRGREIASQHMGAALLLDHWAGIVRERGSLETVGRRDH